ncbi:MAG: antibiotic biosynthesis monooxygenase [Maricaulaceae bacterium]|jgi:quinol monooxygenase YgiN
MTHVVLYRFDIKPDKEADFVAAWARLTDVIRQEHGTFGSRLHRSADGTYLAYARWPSREAFDLAEEKPVKSAARALMASTISHRYPPEHLEIVEDRLVEGG